MNDVHELTFLKDQIDELKDKGLFKQIPLLESANEPEVLVNGHRLINLCSNNYLGFANHPRLKQAAIAAIEKYGVGAGAVKTIAGNLSLHAQLETELAKFKREEAVMLFQSGFNCNAGVIQAVTAAGDLIISDELNHASIIDGVRCREIMRNGDTMGW